MKRMISTLLISLFAVTLSWASGSRIVDRNAELLPFLDETAAMNREYDSIVRVDRSQAPRLEYEFGEKLSRYEEELTKALAEIYLTGRFGQERKLQMPYYEYIELVCKADPGAPEEQLLERLELSFGRISGPKPASAREFLVALITHSMEVSPEKLECLERLAQITPSAFNRMWYDLFVNRIRSASDEEELRGVNQLIYRYAGNPQRILPEVRRIEIERNLKYADERERSAVMETLHRRAGDLLDEFSDLPEEYNGLKEDLLRMKTSLERKYFSVSLSGSVVYPGDRLSVKIDGFNVEEYEVNLYRLDESERLCHLYEQDDLASLTRRSELLETKKTKVKTPLFGISREVEVGFTCKNPGNYLITVSCPQLVTEYMKYCVSSMYLSYRNGIEGPEVFLADARTGHAYGEADFNVYARKLNGGNSEYITVGSRRISMENRFNRVPFEHQDQYEGSRYFNFTDGEDRYYPVVSVYDYREREISQGNPLRAALLSDRPLYTYGDEVRTKVVVYDGRDGHVQKDEQVRFKVEDAKGEEIYECLLTTDEYGAAMASFKVDRSVRAGRLFMKAEGVGKSSGLETAHHQVRVEDYYIPAFRLELDPQPGIYSYDDRFVLSGRAESYSGNPMTGIDVSISYGPGSYRRDTLLQTDTEGRFRFETSLTDFSLGRRRGSYYLDADVVATSASGEKIQAHDFCIVGNSLYIDENIPSLIFSDADEDYELHLYGQRRMEYETIWKVSVDGRYEAGISQDINRIKYLEPGMHRLLIQASVNGLEVEKSREVIVLDKKASRLPSGVDTVLVADAWLKDRGLLAFYAATGEKDLNLHVELLDGRTVLHQENIQLSRAAEIRTFSLPDSYPDRFTVSFYTVRNSQAYHSSFRIDRTQDNRHLEISVRPERTEMLSGERQKVKIRICDENGRPAKSQLLVSVYNSSLDRWGGMEWALPRAYRGYAYPENIQSGNSCYYRYGYGVRSNLLMQSAPEMNDAVAESAPEEKFREDFNESLYYSWNLETDSHGEADFELNAGDLLTEFKIKVMAHTKDGRTGTGDTLFTVNKNLLLGHSLPSYLREGDAVEASVAITNSTSRDMIGMLDVHSEDAGITAVFEEENIRIPAGQTVPAVLKISVDDAYFEGRRDVEERGAAELLISVRSSEDSDAVKCRLDILPKYKYQYISRLAFIDKGETERMAALEGTTDRQRLTLVAPYDLIASAGYELKMRRSPTFVSLLSNFAAERVLARLTAIDPDTLAVSERHFAAMLEVFQNYDGGICWIGGMRPSAWMTMIFCEQMYELDKRDLYHWSENEKIRESLEAALYYLYSGLNEVRKDGIGKNTPVIETLSILQKFGFERGSIDEYIQAYRRQTDTIRDFSGVGIDHLCAVMDLSRRLGDDQVVERAYDALMKYAVTQDGVTYFPNANQLQGSFDAEMDAHLRIMSVLDFCGKDKVVEKMMKRVLLQRSLYDWGTSLSTLKIAEFLLSEYPVKGDGAAAQVDGLGRVKPDGRKSYDLSGADLSRGLKIRNRGDQPLVAVIYARQNVRVDSLKVDYNGVEMYFDTNEKENRGVCTYDLISPLYMQYVVFEGRSSANLRNAGERSGLIYVGGVLCYREIRKEGVRYYFERLPRGAMRIQENYYRVMPGECIVSAPALYSE